MIWKPAIGKCALLSLFLLSGCGMGAKRFLDVEPVNSPAAKTRPVVIEVSAWQDERIRKFECGTMTACFLLPLWPYGSQTVQNFGTPPSPQSAGSGANAPATGFGGAEAATQIPALLANYLSNSGIGAEVLLEGAPFRFQEVAHDDAAQSSPQADILVKTTLRAYEFRMGLTLYGTTFLGFAASLSGLSGSKHWYTYDFSFEALDARLGKPIVSRHFKGVKATGFMPFFGVPAADTFTDCDLLGHDVHQACRSFVAELDKALPPPEDTAYWAEVARARERRVAQAAAAAGNAVLVSAGAIPPATSPTPPVAPVANPAAISSPLALRRQRALVIGVNAYLNFPRLSNAVNDAQSVAQALRDLYGFEVDEIYDAQATRQGILATVRSLVQEMGEGDNLLVYYAGRGWEDEVLKEGYWIPCEASEQSHYLSNADLHKFIRAMEKAQHVFVVADSCFSGDFLTRSADDLRALGTRPAKAQGVPGDFFRKVDNRKSRLVLTSGANEPVVDGGREGHSVFGYYFLRALTNPDEPVFTSTELINRVAKAVGENARQTPLSGTLKETGHEGGEMVFQIKK